MKLFGFVFGVLLAHQVHCLSFGIPDVAKSGVDTGVGMIKKVPDVLPSPNTLFQASKNVVAGYPFDVAFKVINAFCRWSLPTLTENIELNAFSLYF